MKNLILFLLFTITSTAQTKHKAYCIKSPHDGDTIELLINVGMDVYLQKSCRLMLIDTPEVSTKNLLEKEAGKKVQQILNDLVLYKEFTIYVFEDDKEKFGRPLIEIEIDNICVNYFLVDNNLAKYYIGDKKTNWTDQQLNEIINFKQ